MLDQNQRLLLPIIGIVMTGTVFIVIASRDSDAAISAKKEKIFNS